MRPIADSLKALVGTAPFRQAAIMVAMSVVIGGLAVYLLHQMTSEIISRQAAEALRVEAAGLGSIARIGGPAALAEAAAERARNLDGRLHLIEDATGKRIAGNLQRWPSELDVTPGSGVFRYPGPDAERLAAGIVVSLGEGGRLLVARDVEEQRYLAARVRWLFLAAFGALAMAGLAGGLLASRTTLSRLGEISRTSDAIMAGDLAGRVPVDGSGDELDRLAVNLNAMLDRIESLMAGLREVSDNIAHDLKTPLNRLRHRAEAALKDATPAAQNEALTSVIEDADELIKTFNALLLIARLEAGALEGAAEPFDLGPAVRDIAELYEPVAEEAGLALTCEADDGIIVRANRQLVGQAIANLVDNAIKYGRATKSCSGAIAVTAAAVGSTARIVVADRGPGIPAADRERVLKRFVRLEASRSAPGTGLGLSLVAAVARLSGGTIALEDNAPGLKVVLTLPLRS